MLYPPKPDGGPAYPAKTNKDGISYATREGTADGPLVVIHNPGMSFRDACALAALPVILSQVTVQDVSKHGSEGVRMMIADMAYAMADAMIEARDKE